MLPNDACVCVCVYLCVYYLILCYITTVYVSYDLHDDMSFITSNCCKKREGLASDIVMTL